MNSRKSIFGNPKDALEFLKKIFPISNYLDGKESEYIFFAGLIRQFIPQGGRILDLGCGGMDKTSLCALLGYEMHAVDDFQDPWHQRDNNLEKLRNLAEDLSIMLTVQDVGNYRLDYPQNYFDGVMINSVIEHLHESPRHLLNNAGYWVCEGGFLFITMPNSLNLRKRLAVLSGKSNYPSVQMFYESIGSWRGHVREYTLSEQEYVVSRNGFTILLSNTYHAMIDLKLKSNLIKQCYKTFCRLFPNLRESLVTVAQKPTGWRPVNEDPDAFRKSMESFVPKGVK